MHSCIETRGFADQFKAVLVAKHLGDDVTCLVELVRLQHRMSLEWIANRIR